MLDNKISTVLRQLRVERQYLVNKALKVIVQRFAYRNVLINQDMIKSFYKLTNKDIKNAIQGDTN